MITLATPSSVPEAPEPLAHEHTLDVRDPLKWQLKIRLYLESLNASDADQWLEGLRLIMVMSGGVVRDNLNRVVTQRCYICKGPFKEGKPAGNAGYHDADRVYVQIFCCNQAEFGDLLKEVMKKEGQIEAARQRGEKAAKQAAIDARRALHNREIRS